MAGALAITSAGILIALFRSWVVALTWLLVSAIIPIALRRAWYMPVSRSVVLL